MCRILRFPVERVQKSQCYQLGEKELTILFLPYFMRRREHHRIFRNRCSSFDLFLMERAAMRFFSRFGDENSPEKYARLD